MWTKRRQHWLTTGSPVVNDAYRIAVKAVAALAVSVAIGYGLIVGIGAGIKTVGTRVSERGTIMAGVQP